MSILSGVGQLPPVFGGGGGSASNPYSFNFSSKTIPIPSAGTGDYSIPLGSLVNESGQPILPVGLYEIVVYLAIATSTGNMTNISNIQLTIQGSLADDAGGTPYSYNVGDITPQEVLVGLTFVGKYYLGVPNLFIPVAGDISIAMTITADAPGDGEIYATDIGPNSLASSFFLRKIEPVAI